MVKRLLRQWIPAVALALVFGSGCSGEIGADPPGVTGPQNPGGTGGNGGSVTPCSATASLAPARLWRLTDQQYVNVVAQVFGVRVPPEVTQADAQPADFTATSEAPDLTVQAKTAEAFAAVAHTAAVGAVATNLGVFLPCSQAAPTDVCVERFIRNRVARAFGRPLTDGETQDLMSLYRTGVMTESPAAGIRLIIEATLQSPSFLYRSELGAPAAGKVKLSAYEVATALSFALMDSVPDETLWNKAQTGTLLTQSVLAAEVDRLLALPAVQANLGAKAGYWLGVEKLRSIIPKDGKLFPEFTTQVKNDLYESAGMFVRDVMANGTINDLLTSNKMYLNADLARVYGIPGVTGKELAPINVAGDQRNAGILTQPAVLAAWSHSDRGDVIHRGLFIYNALVCAGTLPQPPANATDVASKFPATATEREKAVLRAKAPEGCGSCHALFDPFGLVTEAYDPIGRFLTTDASGKPVDTTTDLKGLGPDLDGAMSGLPDLVSRLKNGQRVPDCAVRNLSVALLGRSVVEDNSCDLQKVKQRLASTGSFRDFYRAMLTSPGFLTRDGDK